MGQIHNKQLLNAIYVKDAEKALNFGADIECRNSDQETPLISAVKKRNLEVVKFLLAKRANPLAVDKNGNNAMQWAQDLRCGEIIKMFEEKELIVPAKKKKLDASSSFAQKQALVAGISAESLQSSSSAPVDSSRAVVKKLTPEFANSLNLTLKNRPAPQANETSSSSSSSSSSSAQSLVDSEILYTAVLEAAGSGARASLSMALKNLKNQNLSFEHAIHDQGGNNPLHLASSCGHEEVVRLLVEAGADLEVKNDEGMTPLILAAQHGYEGVVRLLVEAGASIRAVDNNGHSATYYAGENQQIIAILTGDLKAIDSRETTGNIFSTFVENISPPPASVEASTAGSSSSSSSSALPDSLTLKKFTENLLEVKTEDEANLLWNKAQEDGLVINIDARDSNTQKTLLFSAVEKDNLEAVKFLRLKNANLNTALGPREQTALELVISNYIKEKDASLLKEESLRGKNTSSQRSPAQERNISRVLNFFINHLDEEDFIKAGLNSEEFEKLKLQNQTQEKKSEKDLRLRCCREMKSALEAHNFDEVKKLLADPKIRVLIIHAKTASENLTWLMCAIIIANQLKKTKDDSDSVKKNLQIVRLLLNHSVDVDTEAKDNKDRTALEIAQHLGMDAIALLIAARKGNLKRIENINATLASNPKLVKDLILIAAVAKANQPDCVNIVLETFNIVGNDRTRRQMTVSDFDQMRDEDGLNPFMLAVLNNNFYFAKRLLDKRANIDEETSTGGETALMLAVRNNQKRAIQFLREQGATLEFKDNKGCTAFMLAVEFSQPEIIAFLAKPLFEHLQPVVSLDNKARASNRSAANIEALSNNGETPLIMAGKREQWNAVMQLIDLGANADAKDEGGNTLLQWALKNRHFAQALIIAARTNQLDEVDSLFNEQNKEVVRASLQIIKEGIKEEIIIEDYAYKALVHAVEQGHVTVLETLLDKLEAHFQISYLSDDLNALLMIAIEKNQKQVVNFLLPRGGVNINSSNKFGETPLMLACKLAHKEIVELLLDSKYAANLDMQDQSGNTALMWVAIRYSPNTTNVFDDNRETPHKDTESVYLSIVEWLLNSKADPNLTNWMGHSPILSAVQKRSFKLAFLLLLNGADPKKPPEVNDACPPSALRTTPLDSIKEYQRALNEYLAGKGETDRVRIPEPKRYNLIKKFENYPGKQIKNTSLLAPFIDYAEDRCNINKLMNTFVSLGETVLVDALFKRIKIGSSERFLDFDINATNEFGYTPLMIACRKGWVEIVRSLLKEGADPKILSTDQTLARQDAFDFAVNLKDGEIKNTILKLLNAAAQQSLPSSTHTSSSSSSSSVVDGSDATDSSSSSSTLVGNNSSTLYGSSSSRSNSASSSEAETGSSTPSSSSSSRTN